MELLLGSVTFSVTAPSGVRWGWPGARTRYNICNGRQLRARQWIDISLFWQSLSDVREVELLRYVS